MADFLLSQVQALPFHFETEVAKFVQAKKDHLTTEGVPAPTAPHPMVEAAVRRIPGTINQSDDFVADYSIVDDSPPPPTLDERKNALAAEVNAYVAALVNQIAPPLKEKRFQFQVSDALAVPEDQRTAGQNEIIAGYAARGQRMAAIHRHAAELESQIHDLTAETIDGWQAAPFPEA